jgi:CBS domain-containing protein
VKTGKCENDMLQVQRLLPSARDRLVVLSTGALLIDAAKLLNGPNINLVIVCDDADEKVGVITKTDIVGDISRCTGCSCTMAASTVMTTDVTFCRPGDWLNDVWATIKDRSLKNVPLVDQESKPLGVRGSSGTARPPF